MTVDDVLQAVHMREEYEFLRMDFPRRAGASAAGKKAAGAAKKKVRKRLMWGLREGMERSDLTL